MSRKASNRVSFSPDVNDHKPAVFLKYGGGGGGGVGVRVAGNRKRVSAIFGFRLPKSLRTSPGRLLMRLHAKVARAVRFVSMRRRSSSRKVSSASLARSRSLVDPFDSHRAEAIEDCIEFLNSSSSLQRSNSVSTNS